MIGSVSSKEKFVDEDIKMEIDCMTYVYWCTHPLNVLLCFDLGKQYWTEKGAIPTVPWANMRFVKSFKVSLVLIFFYRDYTETFCWARFGERNVAVFSEACLNTFLSF